MNIKQKIFFTILEKIYGIPQYLDFQEILDNVLVHVVDVGARYGYHERWNQFGNCLKMSMFEPDVTACAELEEIYKGDKRVSIYNIALSETGENIKIYVPDIPDSSSAYKHDIEVFSKFEGGERFDLKKIVEVPSKKLSDVITDSIDFLKLDVEAFELPILKGMGDMLSNAVGFETEVSYTKWAEDVPMFSDIDQFARSNGLILATLSKPSYWHYKVSDPRYKARGIPVSGDALYFISPFDAAARIASGKWGEEKIKIAATLYLAYGNYEFVSVLLDEAEKHKIIDKNDFTYKAIVKAIDRKSGKNKIFPYNKIRNLKLFYPNSLDY